MFLFLFPLLLVSVFVSDVIATKHYSIHESRDIGTDGWHKQSRAHPDSMLPMQIALAQQNLESAEHLLLSISNPTSPQFSQYLTAKEVGQRFAPSTEGVAEVLRWLNEAGISKSRITRSHSGGWLNFNATIMETEQLLKTQYHIYQQSETTELRVACDKYSLPKMLQRHVDFVMPTIHLGNSLQPSLTGPKSDRRRSLFKGESVKVSDIMRASTATQSSSNLSSSVPSNCWKYT
jgi:tripeptidyl-peptidase-1